MSPLFKSPLVKLPSLLVTVWIITSLLVQVTVVPAFTVVVAWLKFIFTILMEAEFPLLLLPSVLLEPLLHDHTMYPVKKANINNK